METTQENQTLIEALRALYNGILPHLPEGWKVTESDDSAAIYRFRFEDGHGHRFDIQTGRTRGAWNVAGRWPQRPDHGPYMYPSEVSEESPAIGVSKSKTPEQIARDIVRRFLPEYLRIFGKLEQKLAEDTAYQNQQAGNWARIAEADNVDARARHDGRQCGSVRIKGADGRSNFDAGYGDVSMASANSVNLDLKSLPIETALRVLAALTAR